MNQARKLHTLFLRRLFDYLIDHDYFKLNMPKVLFNDTSVRHCRCPFCPVQAKSACVRDKKEKMPKERRPTAEEMPGVYCSSGRAICRDLDPTQACLCPTCLVWADNNLISQYYCLKGSADENG